MTPDETKLESVTIYDRPYLPSRLEGAKVAHQYQAWCNRCLRHVESSSRLRISVWATKRPAVKAAREHLAMHATRETHLDRLVKQGSTVICEVVS